MRPVGTKENFYIHDGYVTRHDNKHFDDRPLKDEWQREVYEYARDMCDIRGLHIVADVGCGSGYKLVHMLGEKQTIGIDFEPAYSFLKETYPDRLWKLATPDYSTKLNCTPDLVICADVIEHVPDPTALLAYIAEMGAPYVVLSTPEVSKLGLGTEDGPPRNVHHVREWNGPQFAALVSDYFTIYEHYFDGSQIVFAGPRT